jgi:hypothetical protein
MGKSNASPTRELAQWLELLVLATVDQGDEAVLVYGVAHDDSSTSRG